MSQADVKTRLKQSLQALALPAHLQRSLFPDWVIVTDELALDFDNWKRTLADGSANHLTDDQRAALEVIDRALEDLPDSSWSPEALDGDENWQCIRELAKQALAAFSWPHELPPSHAEEFVPQA